MKIWAFLSCSISPSAQRFSCSKSPHKIHLKVTGAKEQQNLLFPSLERLPGHKSHIFVKLTNASPFCLLIHSYSIACYYCSCIFRTDTLTSTLVFTWRCSPTCL